MSAIKFPTNYLRDRRISLGLTQHQVAEAIGVEKWAMQKLEQRGELPDIHFEKLSQVLNVSVIELYIEKYAPVMREIFQIPTERFRQWVKTNVGTDRAFGHKVSQITDTGSTHLDRAGLLKLFREVVEEARMKTPEEGFKDLIASGIYTPEGKLAPEYGGPKKK